jgi:predicted PurR-regulated permease PerM
MRDLGIRLGAMTTPYDTLKQQRVLWGCSLVVGFILIYYAGAPIIPVIAGCFLVPAMSALRSWFRLRK